MHSTLRSISLRSAGYFARCRAQPNSCLSFPNGFCWRYHKGHFCGGCAFDEKYVRTTFLTACKRTNFVVTYFCLVRGVRIQIFKGGKFCQHLNTTLIIFYLLIYSILLRAPKHRTFWRDNGSLSNSLTCGNFASCF